MYADITYNSKNRLARFSHRKRLSIALKFMLNKGSNKVLDYGAGDGKFLKDLLLNNTSFELNAFEPIMEIEKTEGITVFADIKKIINNNYDIITCFEVLEHFNKEAQLEILANLDKMLDDDGFVIISVPIEIGFPSLVKNVRRMLNGNTNFSYLKNTLKSFVGLDIPEIRTQEGYIYSHIGFNHKKLEKLFLEKFKITQKTTSPFVGLPTAINSQVFYKLVKK